MNSASLVVLTVLIGLLLVSTGPAALVPPVDPILPGENHITEYHMHEDHSGHSDSGSDFTSTVFSGASFVGADLTGIKSSGQTHFVGTDFRGADFEGSRIFATEFRNANFGGARLFNVDIRGGDFQSAIFHDPVFGYAKDIERGDWSFSSFVNVDLSGLTFKTSLWGTNFRGANLRGASFPEDDTFSYGSVPRAIFDSSTTYDAFTVFPAGFDPVAEGLTFVPEPSSCLLAAIGVVVLIARRRYRRQNANWF